MAVRNGKNFAMGLNFGFSATSDFLSHASTPSKGAPDQRMCFLSILLGFKTISVNIILAALFLTEIVSRKTMPN